MDLHAQGLHSVTPLPTPVVQVLASVSGNLTSLPAALKEIAARAGVSTEHPAWVEVTVQEDDYLPDLAARIASMTEDLPVEVLRTKRQRGTATAQLLGEPSESLQELTPQDVFARRLAQESLAPELQTALQQRYEHVLHSVTTGEAA